MIETRLLIFIVVLAIMMTAEAIWSRRERNVDLLYRWPGNFGISMLDTIIVRLLLPTGVAGVAALAAAGNIGLFNWLETPASIAVPLSVILLDLIIYGQHRLFHVIPALWRIHRMHHTDLEIDASTGLRFHPLEIILSALIKMAAAILLGAPIVAVLIFEIVLSSTSLFNHANFKLPLGADALIRKIIVTPDMHRVHHSTIPAETNSNFGFCLSWWDRLFSTYTAQPQKGHTDMSIGLAEYREPEVLRLDRMLINPFLKR